MLNRPRTTMEGGSKSFITNGLVKSLIQVIRQCLFIHLSCGNLARSYREYASTLYTVDTLGWYQNYTTASIIECAMACLDETENRCIGFNYADRQCLLLETLNNFLLVGGNSVNSSQVHALEGANLVYKDCHDAFESGQVNPGVYTLQPAGFKTFDAWCDFDEYHGWTVIQRRIDGSEDFQRDWVDFKEGFGDLTEEYWLGNDHIHALTFSNQKLSIRLSMNGSEFTANYSMFSITDENDNYRLSVSGYSGDLCDALAEDSAHNLNGQEFSTQDRDNDVHSGHCALDATGAWWHRGCTYSHLNAMWTSAATTTRNYMLWIQTGTAPYNAVQRSTMRITRILQGLHDSHDIMVSHTLQALSHLVPVLTGSVVIGTDRRDTFIESSARSARLRSALPSQQSHKQQSTREEGENLTVTGSVNEDDVSSPKKSQRKPRPQRKPRETKPRSEHKPLKPGAKKSADSTDSTTTSQAVRSPSVDSQTDQLNTSTRQTSLHSSEAVQSDDEELDSKSDEDFSDWDDIEDTSIVATDNHSDRSNSADDTHELSSQQLNRPNEQSGIIRKLDSTEKYGETSLGGSTVVSKSGRSTRGSMSLKSATKIATKQSTPKINDDFSQLDIKASVKKAASPSGGEMDFFADMVPTIKSSASSSQDKKPIDNSVAKPPKKAGGTNLAFALQSTESELKDGWGGEEDGWDW